MVSNRKLGNTFEADFCEILYGHGFWVHNLAQNQAGQPADVIAVKGKLAYLIDCKVCSSKGFPYSRVEDNQHLSMQMWAECGNGAGWFALRIADEIYMVPYHTVKYLSKKKSTMNLEEIRKYGTPIEEWIKNADKRI